VNATPVAITVAGFVIVTLNVDVPPTTTVDGVKVFTVVGACACASTDSARKANTGMSVAIVLVLVWSTEISF
jgi:hypothetical protein